MRKLKTPDVFNAFRMIKKANLREEIKPILKQVANSELTIEDMGIDGILGVIEILTENKSEKAFYEVLTGPFEMTVEEVEELDLMVFVDNLEALAKENDLKRFFTLLAGLISKS
jgi:tRNA A22 N-methylase